MRDPSDPLEWTSDGQPRSRLFGDVYFSAEDGLAETRAVFLDGCGLPEAWAGRRRFVVGELGFGSGLNIAALLQLWRDTATPDAWLHVFSVEAFPITAADANRALSRWPELAPITALLTARWPGRAHGVHRLELPELRATVDVAVMDATEALAGWTGAADAWFLDGFSPALNPQMWSDDLLRLVAERSAPGTRAGTFTVAGQVRRGLGAAGFDVEKRPGFGRKRQRLEARLPGHRAETPARRVAVIGAGIGGAAAARAIRSLGGEAFVVEAAHPGSGASGNPAALVTPRLDAGLGPPAQLFAQTFARAVALYAEQADAILARGVLQLARGPRDLDRFGRIAGSDLFEPGTLIVRTPEDVSIRLGEPAPAALDQLAALVVEPAPILAAWAGDEILQARVDRLAPSESGWSLLDAAGAEIAQADAVVLAAGAETARLAPELPLRPVRGQASWASGVVAREAAAWGGYAAPMRDGFLFGATHDRDDVDDTVREADHRRNRETLAGLLPGRAAAVSDRRLGGRASVRATTPDRLPLAGGLAGAPGLFVLSGLGSRGFALAPSLAEHVAALVVGAPSPLPKMLAALVDPDRFRVRAERRARS